PLIPLQVDEPADSGEKVLTNYMFPQQPRAPDTRAVEYKSESESFNAELWEQQRQQRTQVAFEFDDQREERDPDTVKVPHGVHLNTLQGLSAITHSSRENQGPAWGRFGKISIKVTVSGKPRRTDARAPINCQPGDSMAISGGPRDVESLPELVVVLIEKNPGLGFSLGASEAQSGPFSPSNMGIFVTRVQPDGPAASLLRPGDRIVKANGYNFADVAHERAVALLKGLENPVELVMRR
uniref:PDZ domain-containing protein n=1 Tax=Petromyzon marinus TaxID=7757 RepID=S4RZX9_PETMA